METKKLEILVVEDSEKHLADARDAIGNAKFEGIDISVTYARNKEEAQRLLSTKRYSGIITDVFMPSNTEGTTDTDRELAYELLMGHAIESYVDLDREDCIVEARSWFLGSGLAPLGVLVAEQAISQEIPVVYCTDSYHHGKKIEPVNRHIRGKMMALVDVGCCLKDENAIEKKWGLAISTLCCLIEIAEMPIKESIPFGPQRESYFIGKYSDIAFSIASYAAQCKQNQV